MTQPHLGWPDAITLIVITLTLGFTVCYCAYAAMYVANRRYGGKGDE